MASILKSIASKVAGSEVKSMAKDAAKDIAEDLAYQAINSGVNRINRAAPMALAAPTQALAAPVLVAPPEFTMDTHTGCTCSCPKISQVGGVGDITVTQLKTLAKQYNIKGRSTMSKTELIQAVCPYC